MGGLLYLVQGTRPDIAFAVGDVSRFNSCYGKAHWLAVKRIVRYLKGTKHLKLKYTNNRENIGLLGYSASDWASDIDKRRSCTGYIFTLQGGAISWGSRRQPTVALSSCEAEYMALSATIQEAIWLKQFGEQLESIFLNSPVSVLSDFIRENVNPSYKLIHITCAYIFSYSAIMLKQLINITCLILEHGGDSVKSASSILIIACPIVNE